MKYGKPKIFNTDQGSQFTSVSFTQVLKNADVKISMDGRARWIDNVMIERLWRTLKNDCVYLYAFETGTEARKGLDKRINRYNKERHILLFLFKNRKLCYDEIRRKKC
jgi:putative transposase